MHHDPERLYALLLEDHPKLEQAYQHLLDACEAGSPEIGELWTALESSLERHFAAEEKYVFPEFMKVSPDEARALRAEHDVIRARLAELGMGVDLHTIKADIAEAFFDALRKHGAREDALLHVWLRKQIESRER